MPGSNGESWFRITNVTLTAVLIMVTAVSAYFGYKEYQLEEHVNSCMVNLNINTPELCTSPVNDLAALEINLHNTGVIGVRYGLTVDFYENIRLSQYSVRNGKLKIGKGQDQWKDQGLRLSRYIEPQSMETIVLAVTADNKTASGELAKIGTLAVTLRTEGGMNARYICRAHPKESGSASIRKFNIVCEEDVSKRWLANTLGFAGNS